ncbi:hypothetical protein D9M69_638700 [compost metagenome]
MVSGTASVTFSSYNSVACTASRARATMVRSDRSDRAARTIDSTASGLSKVTTSARALWMPQRRSNSIRVASP